jgi:hypothetical protein
MPPHLVQVVVDHAVAEGQRGPRQRASREPVRHLDAAAAAAAAAAGEPQAQQCVSYAYDMFSTSNSSGCSTLRRCCTQLLPTQEAPEQEESVLDAPAVRVDA